MRLNKHLSTSWYCSRRKADEYIQKWFVLVNDVPAHLGQDIDPSVDKITINNEEIRAQEEFVYYKINKPYGVITSCANSKLWEQNIVDIINIKERVFPVWRLDKNTTGLILLTNDWRLSNYLTHPRYNHEKEYFVQVYWTISDDALYKLWQGITILSKKTKKAKVFRKNSGAFSIILTEWRNRQIRRMVEKVGLEVKKLKRIRIENILLSSLKEGEYQPLSIKERNKLLLLLGLEVYHEENKDGSKNS